MDEAGRQFREVASSVAVGTQGGCLARFMDASMEEAVRCGSWTSGMQAMTRGGRRRGDRSAVRDQIQTSTGSSAA